MGKHIRNIAWLLVFTLAGLVPAMAMAAKVVPMVTKRGETVGTLTMHHADGKLHLAIDSDHKVRRVHIDVAGSPGELKFNKAGHAKLGKFLYKGHGEARMSVDLSTLPNEVFVAARAVVKGKGKAWAGEHKMRHGRGAYTSYVIEAEDEVAPEEVAADPLVNRGKAQFRISEATASEQTGFATIMIDRVDGSEETLTVNFATVELADGGAQMGVDFYKREEAVVFLPGEVAKAVTVIVPDDFIANESSESFGVVLTPGADCDDSCLGSPAEMRVLIEDMPTVTIDTSADAWTF